ncbi:Ionotropic receptor 110 [Halyomorpha halys]|nr:Ionotropic receptor 110 [Halyomorpha halys]
MFWLVFCVVGIEAIIYNDVQYQPDIVDCVTAITDQFLDSHCLAFLFPMNYTQPSVTNVPPLVRSPLLKNIHEKSATYLPATNYHRIINLLYDPPLGAVNYLRCAHIVILDEQNSYEIQINDILYTFYNNHYKDGGGKETKMIIVSTKEVNESDIHSIHFKMFTMGDIDVVFLAPKNNILTLFTWFPFGRNGFSCPERNNDIEILNKWENGKFSNDTNLFPKRVPKLFNGCKMKVSVAHYPPLMIFDDNGNPSDGVEYRIIEIIAKGIGLEIDYVTHYDWVWSDGKTVHGAAVDVLRGTVWMMATAGTNTDHSFSCTIVSSPYMTGEIAWFFQDPVAVPTWKLIYMGFDGVLWTLVILTIVMFAFVIYLFAKYDRNTMSLDSISSCMLASWSFNLGTSSISFPSNEVIRLVIAAYLLYTMHIDLAYTGALTGLITTGKLESEITSYQQILEKKIRTGAKSYIRYLLMYIDDPLVAKVVHDNFQIEDMEKAFEIMEKFRNISILDNTIYMLNKIKVNRYNVYQSKLNIGTFYFGVEIRRNHFLEKRIADLSSKIFESGISAHIIDQFTAILKASQNEMNLYAYTLEDLTGPFFALFLGHSVAILVFFGELIKYYLSRYSHN